MTLFHILISLYDIIDNLSSFNDTSRVTHIDTRRLADFTSLFHD